MMLLDVAPPDFAVVDAWAPVADGPFGVMGCHRPAEVRHLYAGADALAVDEAVLGDLGVADPRRAPIVAPGLPLVRAASPRRPRSTASARRCAGAARRARARALLRGLGTVSYPIYMYLSNDGELFVPAMDTAAFPPSAPVGAATRAVRLGRQRAFGLRAPARRADAPVPDAQARGVLGDRPGRPRPGAGAGDRRQPAVRAVAVPGLGRATRPARPPAPARQPRRRSPRRIGCTRPERLRAWLDVGVELGELARRAGRYRVRGRRARAIAAGDPLLTAHYRSMLDYQTGPYAGLDGLLRAGPGAGRADLSDHADVIAEVSLAAAPFVAPFLDQRRRPIAARAGSSTSAAAPACTPRSLLDADPQVLVDGIDLAAERRSTPPAAEVRAAGLDGRIRLHAGDVRTLGTRGRRPATTSSCCSTTSTTSRARTGPRSTSGSARC